jgi:hypothetical protein
MSYAENGVTVINLQRVVIVGSGTTDPSTPAAGTTFFNTSTGVLKGWNGSAWVNLIGA